MRNWPFISVLALALTMPGCASVRTALSPAPAKSAATGAKPGAAAPWMDTALSPDARAELLEAQMTLDEKISLVHGVMATPLTPEQTIPAGALPGAGYVPGIPRVGIPALKETDAGLGVAYVMGLRRDGATALPSGLATAASWDRAVAYAGGAMIGQEAWRKGFNVMLAGGVDLERDPRGGRNFEYLGEDPLLAGTLAGEAISGIQAQHVVSTVKHFALNDQETGRQYLNVKIAPAAAHESDLLAFELAIEGGHPGSVMCSYNRVNGPYACGNNWLLNKVLKTEWKYPGWVMSDWGAVHGTDAALAGLDQESGDQLDQEVYFGAPLLAAAKRDPVYAARLDNMVHRVLCSMFAAGLFDHPPVKTAIDFEADGKVARKVADEGIVLLSNPRNLLPLSATVRRIAVIGGHADIGVISGGGSSQVAPKGGPVATIPLGGNTPLESFMHQAMYMPSSPLEAIRARAPNAEVAYNNGAYPAAAADLARRSDVAIVFATKWMGEGSDTPDLTLPNGQDSLINAVAAANPNTIVVLETGGPVLMPWLKNAGAVIEAWFPGARGGEAIANVLFGAVNPSGHLPVTFPAALSQLPDPVLKGRDLPEGRPFDVSYREGADVGYRWFARRKLKPLFPFGYGLSYTSFAFGGLQVEGGKTVRATFTVTNTGQRAGSAVPQVYLTTGPAGEGERLLGWSRVDLAPGETKTVTVSTDPRLLANWNAAAQDWQIAGGRYAVAVGTSAQTPKLTSEADVAAQALEP